MTPDITSETILRLFPQFTDNQLRESLVRDGRPMRVPAGTVIIDYDDPVRMMPLVLDGNIKVSRLSDDGGELLLYFLGAGDSCAMTFTCCEENKRSEVKAVTEEDTTILGLPLDRFPEWMFRYRCWQQFVLQSYSRRMNELIFAVDQVAFNQLDVRLHNYIEKRASMRADQTVQATHRNIADDLNVSREAISRLLKALEKRGSIALGRNQIRLLRPVA